MRNSIGRIKQYQSTKFIKTAKSAKEKNGHRYPKKRIYRAYDHILYRRIKDTFKIFSKQYNDDVDKIIFQCDNGCRDFIKNNGLTCGTPDDAHMLADIVAWSNNREIEPDGVQLAHLADPIKKELEKKFG